jgi:hypothetical protein
MQHGATLYICVIFWTRLLPHNKAQRANLSRRISQTRAHFSALNTLQVSGACLSVHLPCVKPITVVFWTRLLLHREA